MAKGKEHSAKEGDIHSRQIVLLGVCLAMQCLAGCCPVHRATDVHAIKNANADEISLLVKEIPNPDFRSPLWNGPNTIKGGPLGRVKQHHALYVLALHGRKGLLEVIRSLSSEQMSVAISARLIMFRLSGRCQITWNPSEEQVRKQQIEWLEWLGAASDEDVASAVASIHELERPVVGG